MTGPVPTEALREALLRACFDPGSIVGPRGGLTTDEWRADACMKQLAPLLAAHQQVTAERDEYAEALMKVAEVGGWQASAGLAAEVRSALARLRAEGEAKDRALNYVKEWIDTELPAGTARAGIAHRVITKALEPIALARAATAREG